MATYTAASASVSDVSTAIGLATHGDTVLIPNGTVTWASGIATTKRIIIAAQNYTPTSGGTDTRNVNITHSAGGSPLFDVVTGNDFSVQISGIKFIRGTGTGEYIATDGTGSKIALVNDCYFDQPNDFSVLRGVHVSAVGGVFWNCLWQSLTPGGGSGPGSGSGCFYVEPDNSAIPWESDSTMGMADTNGNLNLYVEDSSFQNIYNQAVDGADSARIVIRYTQVLNSQFLTHGSTGLQGGRQFEVYNCQFQYQPALFGNTYTDVALNRYMWFRAGTGLFADCSWENITSSTWGNKDELNFTVENLRRGDFGGVQACCTVYPCYHQTGFGWASGAQASDPIYIWGITGFTPLVGFPDGTPNSCGGGAPTSSSFVVLNRDYFLGSTAKPGYTKYTYPHPARGESPGDTTLNVTNLSVGTLTVG